MQIICRIYKLWGTVEKTAQLIFNQRKCFKTAGECGLIWAIILHAWIRDDSRVTNSMLAWTTNVWDKEMKWGPSPQPLCPCNPRVKPSLPKHHNADRQIPQAAAPLWLFTMNNTPNRLNSSAWNACRTKTKEERIKLPPTICLLRGISDFSWEGKNRKRNQKTKSQFHFNLPASWTLWISFSVDGDKRALLLFIPFRHQLGIWSAAKLRL